MKKSGQDIKDKINKDNITDCEFNVENTHRAVGTRLSHYVYNEFGNNALNDDTLLSLN